jgi:hypothetical protein
MYISPVPNVSRRLITAREAIAATGFSSRSLKAARENGHLIEGVHYHLFQNLVYFDEFLIKDWALHYYAAPKRHQIILDKFYEERARIQKAVNFHKGKGKGRHEPATTNCHSGRNRSGHSSAAN